MGPGGYAFAKWIYGTNRRRFNEAYDKRKVIFIHIPKTGGTSIARLLTGKRTMTHDHFSLNDYYMESRSKSREYLKFCMVRNPWDRLVSAYEHLQNPPHYVASVTHEFSKKFIRGRSFEEVVIALMQNPWMRRWVHFRSQWSFVTYQGHLGVNKILRFENFDKDLVDMMSQLHMDGTYVPHENRSKRDKDYRDYYTNEYLIDAVRSLYNRDISEFGYHYDK